MTRVVVEAADRRVELSLGSSALWRRKGSHPSVGRQSGVGHGKAALPFTAGRLTDESGLLGDTVGARLERAGHQFDDRVGDCALNDVRHVVPPSSENVLTVGPQRRRTAVVPRLQYFAVRSGRGSEISATREWPSVDESAQNICSAEFIPHAARSSHPGGGLRHKETPPSGTRPEGGVKLGRPKRSSPAPAPTPSNRSAGPSRVRRC